MRTIVIGLLVGVCVGVAAVTAVPEEPRAEAVPELQIQELAPRPYYPPCSSMHGQACSLPSGFAHCWSYCAHEPGVCTCDGVWDCIPPC